MLKDYVRIFNMGKLGVKYIYIFKKTYFHPFISLKPAYRQLSEDRQNYSNSVLRYLNINVKIVGNMPKEDKILYAINHRSLLDILVMENVFSRFQKSGTWIAKQELFDDPIYGKFFQYSGCLGVDLENGKGMLKFFKTLKKILSKVDDLNIFMFPEGERYKGKGIKKFQNGAQKIAKANKLKIVPVYINDELEKVFRQAPYQETKIIEIFIGDVLETNDDLEQKYKELMIYAQDISENR